MISCASGALHNGGELILGYISHLESKFLKLMAFNFMNFHRRPWNANFNNLPPPFPHPNLMLNNGFPPQRPQRYFHNKCPPQMWGPPMQPPWPPQNYMPPQFLNIPRVGPVNDTILKIAKIQEHCDGNLLEAFQNSAKPARPNFIKASQVNLTMNDKHKPKEFLHACTNKIKKRKRAKLNRKQLLTKDLLKTIKLGGENNNEIESNSFTNMNDKILIKKNNANEPIFEPVEVEVDNKIILSILSTDPTLGWQPLGLNSQNISNFTLIHPESFNHIRITEKMSHIPPHIKIEIVTIELVQNPYLMSMYNLKKCEMGEMYGDDLVETEMFHGATTEQVDAICENNFDWRLCGSSHGVRYGQGVSFSPRFWYARRFCKFEEDVKSMLLCKVLYLNSHYGNEMTYISKEGFDSTVSTFGDVIVKYNDDLFYPEYRIRFKIIK